MTTLVRWDPVREVAAMQGELSRLMNGLFEGPGRQAQAWVPVLDVWETDDAIFYAFDLPGVPEEKLSIEVEEGSLTLTATRERHAKATEGRFERLERRYGTFSRTVGLPQGVDEESIEASYQNGVLEIRVPKPEQPKPRRVAIGVNGAAPATIEENKSDPDGN